MSLNSLEEAKRDVARGYDYFWAKRPHLTKPTVPTRMLDFRLEEVTRFLALSADGTDTVRQQGKDIDYDQ